MFEIEIEVVLDSSPTIFEPSQFAELLSFTGALHSELHPAFGTLRTTVALAGSDAAGHWLSLSSTDSAVEEAAFMQELEGLTTGTTQQGLAPGIEAAAAHLLLSHATQRVVVLVTARTGLDDLERFREAAQSVTNANIAFVVLFLGPDTAMELPMVMLVAAVATRSHFVPAFSGLSSLLDAETVRSVARTVLAAGVFSDYRATVVGFDLDLNMGEVIISFSQPVVPGDLQPGQITIQQAVRASDASDAVTLGEAVVLLETETAVEASGSSGSGEGPSDGGLALVVVLSTLDLNRIKSRPALATSAASTHLSFAMDSARVMGVSVEDALPVDIFLPDVTPPLLLAASFRLAGLGGELVLAMRFSEVMDLASLDVSQLTVQVGGEIVPIAAAGNPSWADSITADGLSTVHLPLADTVSSTIIILSNDDQAAARIVPFLRIAAGSFADMAGNLLGVSGEPAPFVSDFPPLDLTTEETPAASTAESTSAPPTPTTTTTTTAAPDGITAEEISECLAGCSGEAGQVCGGDGKTYDSSCHASCSGQLQYSAGACASTSAPPPAETEAELLSFDLDMNMGEMVLVFSRAVNIDTFAPGQVAIQSEAVTGPLTLSVTLANSVASLDSSDLPGGSGEGSSPAPSTVAAGTWSDQVLVMFGEQDRDALKSAPGLADSATTSFLVLGADAFAVEHGAVLRAVPASAAKAVSIFIEDQTAPAVVSFRFLLSPGANQPVIELVFSEPVAIDSVDVTDIGLQNTQTAAASERMYLSGGMVDLDGGGRVLRVTMLVGDVGVLSTKQTLGRDFTSTFLLVRGGAAADMAGHGVTPITEDYAMTSIEHTVDLLAILTGGAGPSGPGGFGDYVAAAVESSPHPALQGFALDLNAGVLVLTFSTKCDPRTAQPSAMVLQTAASQTASTERLRLRGGRTNAWSLPSSELWAATVILADEDAALLRSAAVLGHSTATTFLAFEAVFIRTADGLPNTPLGVASAMQATSVVTDSLPPTLKLFILDLDHGRLVLQFSEAIDTTDAALGDLDCLAFLDQTQTPAVLYHLSGDSALVAERASLRQVEISLAPADQSKLVELGAGSALGSAADAAESGLFLTMEDSCFTDYARLGAPAILPGAAVAASAAEGSSVAGGADSALGPVAIAAIACVGALLLMFAVIALVVRVRRQSGEEGAGQERGSVFKAFGPRPEDVDSRAALEWDNSHEASVCSVLSDDRSQGSDIDSHDCALPGRVMPRMRSAESLLDRSDSDLLEEEERDSFSEEVGEDEEEEEREEEGKSNTRVGRSQSHQARPAPMERVRSTASLDFSTDNDAEGDKQLSFFAGSVSLLAKRSDVDAQGVNSSSC